MMINIWKTVVTERYALFEGRAGLAEFWWYTLANIVISLGFFILSFISGLFAILNLLFALALIIPGIAVSIRRMHDTDKSGWLLLIGLIPFVGFIVLIVFFATAGTQGDNNYGPVPAPIA